MTNQSRAEKWTDDKNAASLSLEDSGVEIMRRAAERRCQGQRDSLTLAGPRLDVEAI